MRAPASLPAILALLQLLNLGASLFAHLASQQALAHVHLAEQRLFERIESLEQVKRDFAMVLDSSAAAFVEAAEGTATDKIDAHSFQYAYHRYLAAHRWKELRVLEIGLGCRMPKGPGGSVVLWSRYLPRARLTVLEFDSVCGTAWQEQNQKAHMPVLVFGDQRDRKFLQSVIREHGPFDVIVDDGGHSMDMQIISFQELFPSLKSEGLYFMEDLHTSFSTVWGGHQDGLTGTTVGYILNRTRDLIADRFKTWSDEREVAGIVRHIDCYKHICVLQRN